MGGYSGLMRGYFGLSGRILGVLEKRVVMFVRAGSGCEEWGLGVISVFLVVNLCAQGRQAPCGREQEREEKKEKNFFDRINRMKQDNILIFFCMELWRMCETTE